VLLSLSRRGGGRIDGITVSSRSAGRRPPGGVDAARHVGARRPLTPEERDVDRRSCAVSSVRNGGHAVIDPRTCRCLSATGSVYRQGLTTLY
jgi:hypothetical protein